MEHWFTVIRAVGDLLNLAAAVTALAATITQRPDRNGNSKQK